MSDTIAAQLRAAVNSHDLEALTDCFASDFVNETPLHPARSFTGSEQVRKNWAQIFAGVRNSFHAGFAGDGGKNEGF